jgi:cell division protease FtsH
MSKTVSLLALIASMIIGFTIISQAGIIITSHHFGKSPPSEQQLNYTKFIEVITKPDLVEGKTVRIVRFKSVFDVQNHVFFTLKGDAIERWAYLNASPVAGIAPDEWLRQLGYEVIMESPFPWSYVLMTSLQGMLIGISSMLGLFVFIYFVTSGQFSTMKEEMTTISASKKQAGPKITFEDVAGLEKEKKEAAQFIEIMRKIDAYKAVGAQTPKGTLLYGPPGTGKSLLARAIIHESKLPWSWMSGSDFHFMLVGVGVKKAEILFEEAIRTAPSIIVIDEIDSAAPSRANMGPFDSKESSSLVNKLLSLMDRIHTEEIPVFVIGITNMIDSLDPALIREGRFDRKIEIGYPTTKEARLAILKVHLAKPKPRPLASDVNLELIAEQTLGFQGASLAALVNEAAIRAANANHFVISQEDFIESIDRVLNGIEKDVSWTEKEREIVATHEAAHAFTYNMLEELDPTKLVTLIPRGRSLGHTWAPPVKNRYIETEMRFRSLIKAALAGRVAEKVILEKVTTTAKQDLETAMRIAYNMVSHYGMSSSGSISSGFGAEYPAISVSDNMRKRIEDEAIKIVTEAEQELTALMQEPENKEKIKRIATNLLNKRRLTGDQVESILAGRDIP